jgi:hypothetical protein
MYALVHKNQVVLTQEFWNTRMINMVLEEDYGIKRRILLAEENDVPIIIDEDTKACTYYEIKPDYNERIEWLDGPLYEVVGDGVVGTYLVKNLDLSIAKDNLKKLLPAARYAKEVKRVEVTIQDQTFTIPADRDSRLLLVGKIVGMNTETINYKVGDLWLDLSKNELNSILRQIDESVQHAFDWEYSKTLEIDACENLEDIDKIKIYTPPKNLNLRGI